MGSTNKTTNIGLNQWIGSDKPQWGDHTWDNARKDAAQRVPVAQQTNASGTAYQSDFPLKAYRAGLVFKFIPVVTSTGNVTLQFTNSFDATLSTISLTALKVFTPAGVQLGSGGLVAYDEYLMVYDPTVDGGNPGLKAYNWLETHKADKVHLGTNPVCKVYNNANQSIANNAATVLAFNSEFYDTDTMHDPVTNNSRITIKTAGKYRVSANVNWNSNVTGRRALELKVNGTTIIASTVINPQADGVYSTGMSVSTTRQFAVNDYIEVITTQGSGGALDVLYFAEYSPHFMAERVG